MLVGRRCRRRYIAPPPPRAKASRCTALHSRAVVEIALALKTPGRAIRTSRLAAAQLPKHVIFQEFRLNKRFLKFAVFAKVSHGARHQKVLCYRNAPLPKHCMIHHIERLHACGLLKLNHRKLKCVLYYVLNYVTLNT